MDNPTITIFGFMFLLVNVTYAWNLEITRIEDSPIPDPFIDVSKVRINRIERGIYGFTGPIEISADLDDTITIEVKLWYSPFGNNQYKLLPLRLQPTGICQTLESHYKKYLIDIANVSDLPGRDDHICPLPAKTYQVNNYVFNQNSLPDYLKTGYYKVIMSFNSTVDDRKSAWTVSARIF